MRGCVSRVLTDTFPSVDLARMGCATFRKAQASAILELPPTALPPAVPTRHRVRSSGEGRPVASESITIRFPSGAWEYAVTERVPLVGDTLVRGEETWAVRHVAEPVDDHRVVIMELGPGAGR